MAENMFSFFIFRDTRVDGNLPFTSSAILAEVDAATSLTTAFARLNQAAKTEGKNGKLKSLFIIAHGMGTGDTTTLNDFWWQGGTGVQTGQERLTSANVSNWSAIKNTVDYIVVYACGAAYTGNQILDPQATNDGQALLSALSRYTNAIVYAADRIQRYFPSDFNFGRWEGTVYMFQPGGQVVPNYRPPIELIDVTSPIDELRLNGRNIGDIRRNV